MCARLKEKILVMGPINNKSIQQFKAIVLLKSHFISTDIGLESGFKLEKVPTFVNIFQLPPLLQWELSYKKITIMNAITDKISI